MSLVRSLKLETRLAKPISNLQVFFITSGEIAADVDYGRRYPEAVRRMDASPVFNCHGLTFASRRTAISDEQAIVSLLADDGYEEIEQDDVRPGDVIIYHHTELGAFWHSGIVAEVREVSTAYGVLKTPWVVSKWGKGGEYLHSYRYGPFNEAMKIEWYRMKPMPLPESLSTMCQK